MFEYIKAREYNYNIYLYDEPVKQYKNITVWQSKVNSEGFLNLIGYHQFFDGETYLIVVPELIDFAVEYIDLHKDNLFLQDTVNEIYNHLKSLYPDIADNQCELLLAYVYGCNDKNDLDMSKKQETTIAFNGDTNYNVIETYKNVFGNITNHGTLINDKIVSIAGADNWCHPEYDENVKVSSIGIGTHEDYRCRGYAVSNLVAHAEYLLDRVPEVLYLTNSRNIASQRTALAAGFKEVGIEKGFWIKYGGRNG